MAPIILFLRDQLITFLDWPPERVRVVSPRRLQNKDGSVNHPHGDGYCLLWPGNMSLNQECLIGGGRVDVRIIRAINISLRSRFGADEQSDAIGLLTDSEFGHAWKEERVIDALLLCQPNDAGDVTGNTGSWRIDPQPVILRSADVPEQEKLDPDWCESRLAFELTYPLAVNQDRQ